MTIDLYTMSWNEEAMLGFFFRHYDPLVDRYVVYDDGSTDNSLAILRDHPKVEVRRFERVVPDSFVASAQKLHNTVWKESRRRADWVIITAIDEHLEHADLAGYLGECKRLGVTLVPAVGYQMLSPDFPQPHERLATTRTIGMPAAEMNKLSIFDPMAIEETHFLEGRHMGNPEGRVRFPDEDVVLNLHYKSLGIDYLLERAALLRTGLGEEDRRRGFGRHYLRSESEIARRFKTRRRKAIDIADPSINPLLVDSVSKWWRA